MEAEKIKPITLYFEDTGKTYTLEFSIDTVRQAERAGFDIDEIGSKPMTMIPELFYWAFKMHHPNISKEKTEHILFEDIGGLNRIEGFAERLRDLYYQPFLSLMGEYEDTEEGTLKNSQMKVNM